MRYILILLLIFAGGCKARQSFVMRSSVYTNGQNIPTSTSTVEYQANW